MQRRDVAAASVVAFRHLTGNDLTVGRFGHRFPQDIDVNVKNKTVALMAMLLDALGESPGLSNTLARGKGSLGYQVKRVADNLTGNELLALVCETLAVKEALTC